MSREWKRGIDRPGTVRRVTYQRGPADSRGSFYASTGQTDIADLDGGANWIPSDSSTRMTLIPEPGSPILLALAGQALFRRRRP